MMWQSIFSAGSILAMIAWAVLILLPRKPLVLSTILYLAIGILSFAYTVGFVSLQAGWVDPGGTSVPGGSFSSIEGVRALFATDGGLTIGWLHYLAFDLFVGLWIAKDADAKDFSRILQAPILFATFMAGPVGLFVWLIVREPAARRAGRAAKD